MNDGFALGVSTRASSAPRIKLIVGVVASVMLVALITLGFIATRADADASATQACSQFRTLEASNSQANPMTPEAVREAFRTIADISSGSSSDALLNHSGRVLALTYEPTAWPDGVFTELNEFSAACRELGL